MKFIVVLTLIKLSLAQIRHKPHCVPVKTDSNGPISSLQLPVCVEDVSSPTTLPMKQKQESLCLGDNFEFSRDNQVTDYVRYRSYFPALKEGTVCYWVITSDHNRSFTGIFSYAVPEADNEILLGFGNSHINWLSLKGRDYTFNVTLPLSGVEKAHVCGWFSSVTQEVGFYLNAVSLGTQTYPWGSTRGGGSLILGQDQDAHNAGRRDSNQAFSGTLSQVFVWPRVLTGSEIDGIAKNCECPRDYSVAATMDRVELIGSAGYRVDSECLVL